MNEKRELKKNFNKSANPALVESFTKEMGQISCVNKVNHGMQLNDFQRKIQKFLILVQITRHSSKNDSYSVEKKYFKKITVNCGILRMALFILGKQIK